MTFIIRASYPVNLWEGLPERGPKIGAMLRERRSLLFRISLLKVKKA